LKTAGQPLSGRAEPQLAEDEEPGFRQATTAMPREARGDRLDAKGPDDGHTATIITLAASLRGIPL
jgi:hypothetical protein